MGENYPKLFILKKFIIKYYKYNLSFIQELKPLHFLILILLFPN